MKYDIFRIFFIVPFLALTCGCGTIIHNYNSYKIKQQKLSDELEIMKFIKNNPGITEITGNIIDVSTDMYQYYAGHEYYYPSRYRIFVEGEKSFIIVVIDVHRNTERSNFLVACVYNGEDKSLYSITEDWCKKNR